MSERIVYFAAAVRGDSVARATVQEMIHYTKSLGVPVLSEHISAADPRLALAEKLGTTKDALLNEVIEQQDMKWLDEATHVIAEVTGASTGVGREIEHAILKHLLGKVPAKVCCLFYQPLKAQVSGMILGMRKNIYPAVSVMGYSTLEEWQGHIDFFLDGRE